MGEMTCADCLRAQTHPRLDAFTNGCTSCLARALAATGAHLESAEAGAMTAQYRSALETVFGEGWKQGHLLVRDWTALLGASSTRKATS